MASYPPRNWTLIGGTSPPKLVWRRPVGAGWSGFAIVGNSAITQEQENDWEKVVCYDLHTGDVKWSHQDSARYNTPLAGTRTASHTNDSRQQSLYRRFNRDSQLSRL